MNVTKMLDQMGSGFDSSEMRGLKNFIMDIRACKSKEAEQARVNKELANIRKNFKGEAKVLDGTTKKRVDGYQRKKYVCKLIYIYLLGYDIDFGHMEAVNLLASSKYWEKSVGYLFISVLLHEEHELVRLLIQSIRNDLVCRNEAFVCLALTCVANIGGREMAETLASDIQRLLVSQDSNSFVKKKSALALLRLYRKSPDVIPMGEWRHSVLNLLDEKDLGVVTSVLSLMLGIVADHSAEYAEAIPRLVTRLKEILHRDESMDDYVYYKVAAPWVQVKILRLVQMYPPPKDAGLRRTLVECLQKIMANSELVKVSQTNNLRHAVLYEAINVIIHLETERELLVQAANLMGRYLSAKETNTRYMALEAMCSLYAVEYARDSIERHQDTVVQALRFERDISVRRRALDLLFTMCNPQNAKHIITALVAFLEHAEYAIREEMVLKIAILAERDAADYSFYVDIILNLIRVAGDYVSTEVWHRVIQIVTNREDIQEYATATCFAALSRPPCHETMVKVGGYILGEFGHLIANDPKSSPQRQFEVLHSKFATASPETRAILLTSYVKFVNLFPEIKDIVLGAFQQDKIARSTNAELQQRAVEYFNLGARATDEVLQSVLEEMPPYPERESSMLAKMKAKEQFVTDKTWNQARKTRNSTGGGADERSLAAGGSGGMAAGASSDSAAGDLLDMGHADVSEPAEPTPGTEKWLPAIVATNQGVVFENAALQIGVKIEARGNLARVIMYYANKGSSAMVQCSSRVYAGNLRQSLRCESKGAPAAIEPRQQVFEVLQCECLADYPQPPLFDFFFTQDGVNTRVTLRLPLFLNKFMQPFTMDKAGFAARWSQLTAPSLESQVVFNATKPMESGLVRKKLEGMGLQVLDNVDPNPSNFVGSGVVHTAAGQIGCLVRLEPNEPRQMWRVTFRTSKPSVAEVMSHLIQIQL